MHLRNERHGPVMQKMTRCFRATVVLTLILAAPAFGAPAECTTDPEFALLDFWVGTWDVFVDGRQIGENKIQKILDGCAVTEDWTDARGAKGHSLFYYRPAEKVWSQVWVTQRPLERGGVKEKRFIGRVAGGGVQFQGDVFVEGGPSYLDRTTLSPRGPDGVRQLIEISVDGGTQWQTVFDGQYRRR